MEKLLTLNWKEFDDFALEIMECFSTNKNVAMDCITWDYSDIFVQFYNLCNDDNEEETRLEEEFNKFLENKYHVKLKRDKYGNVDFLGDYGSTEGYNVRVYCMEVKE